MFAWGVSKEGQTALGTTGDQTRPAKFPVGVENVVSVAAGPHACLALTSEGDLYSWGTGLSGELGLAYIPKQEAPAKLQKVACKFKAISVGQEHALAISESGDIYVWGANDFGQLGTGDMKPLDRPTKLKIAQKFVQVSAGAKHSLALTDHGLIYVWGAAWAGQLGNSSTETVLAPVLLSEDINCKYIYASENLSLALNNRGKVLTWGSGTHGKLGHGDVKPQPTPKIIDHLTKVNVTAAKVVAGLDHMLLLSDKGELWAWGAGANGETAQNTPVRRMLPHPVLFAPSAKSEHSQDDSSNANGSPESAPTPGPFVDIAAGYQFCVAVAKNGELYSWGNSRNGVLGNGETSGIVSLATKVDTDVTFTKVFASRDHVIALGTGEGAEIVPSPEPEPQPEEANGETPDSQAQVASKSSSS